MLNFNYCNKANIIFGKKEEENTGRYTAQFGKRVLLHYGSGSIKKTGLYDKIIKSLNDYNLEITELGGVKPNPVLSMVNKGIDICRKKNIDIILAVGGGSVIDSAKAIAVGTVLPEKEDIWEYFMDKSKKINNAINIGVVLTIPATGSESSTSCVITNEDGYYKRSIGTSEFIPKFSILNPELTYTLPAYQTACGCSDIISHLMERYFTQVKNVDLTDRLIEASIKTVLINGVYALKNPTDYNSRAEIMWAGTLAHNGLLNTGRIGDWASHYIEHELSGIYDIAHGAGLSIITLAWIKYVYKENIDKFLQFAQRVFCIDIIEDKEKAIFEMIYSLENWYKQMGLPTRLSDINIDNSRFEEMAKKAMVAREHVGNFKKLYFDDIIKILELAL